MSGGADREAARGLPTFDAYARVLADAAGPDGASSTAVRERRLDRLARLARLDRVARRSHRGAAAAAAPAAPVDPRPFPPWDLLGRFVRLSERAALRFGDDAPRRAAAAFERALAARGLRPPPLVGPSATLGRPASRRRAPTAEANQALFAAMTLERRRVPTPRLHVEIAPRLSAAARRGAIHAFETLGPTGAAATLGDESDAPVAEVRRAMTAAIERRAGGGGLDGAFGAALLAAVRLGALKADRDDPAALAACFSAGRDPEARARDLLAGVDALDGVSAAAFDVARLVETFDAPSLWALVRADIDLRCGPSDRVAALWGEVGRRETAVAPADLWALAAATGGVARAAPRVVDPDVAELLELLDAAGGVGGATAVAGATVAATQGDAP